MRTYIYNILYIVVIFFLGFYKIDSGECWRCQCERRDPVQTGKNLLRSRKYRRRSRGAENHRVGRSRQNDRVGRLGHSRAPPGQTHQPIRARAHARPLRRAPHPQLVRHWGYRLRQG